MLWEMSMAMREARESWRGFFDGLGDSGAAGAAAVVEVVISMMNAKELNVVSPPWA